MTTPKVPPAKVIEMYQELLLSMSKAESLLWKILSHPTATDEQLAAAVTSYRASNAGGLVIRDSLRKVFPQPKDDYARGYRKLYPWNRD